MANAIRLADIVVDCADEKKLAAFYEGLLGWKTQEFFGHPALVSDYLMLVFIQEEDYVPPIWPEQDGVQQKQLHFDFLVPDVPAAVARAEALGAVKAQVQFGGDAFTTMLDPAGHPFCLCKEE